MGLYHKLLHRAFEPVDNASLVFFRISFGIIILWEVGRYLAYDWIKTNYISPTFHFKFYGFEWIEPWSGNGMYWHFALIGVLAFLITTGAFYYVATALFVATFGYFFLLDQSYYLNHLYLVLLVSVLMCLVPAHRTFSIDAWLRPRTRSNTAPAWSLWILRIQFEILLLFAGIVKLNSDWLHLQPLTMWLGSNTDFPVIGPLFTETWVVAVAAYGVIALHLIGAPLLFWRWSRPWVFSIYVVFHLFNHLLFDIGIFPWFTIAGTLLFFEPDWPRRLTGYALSLRRVAAHSTSNNPNRVIRSVSPIDESQTPVRLALRYKVAFGFLAMLFIYQILFPLRHFLYPGNVAWTEEGHRFAWRMMLRSKQTKAAFEITHPSSKRVWYILPRDYLTARQARKMPKNPDMVLQFAHHLAERWRVNGFDNVEVRASVWCSLNGRAASLLVDRERDLTKVKSSIWPADWILPLREPLRPVDPKNSGLP